MPDYNCEIYRRQLQAWLADNPTADDMRKYIADGLIRMDPRGWRVADLAGLRATWLLGQVWTAENSARSDIQYRQPVNGEYVALQEVRGKAKQLLDALQGVRILDAASDFLDIGNEPMAVSWTRTRAENQERCDQAFAHISLPFLLDALRDKCEELIKSRPARAVARVGEGCERDAYIRAFIRRLDAQIRRDARCTSGDANREIYDTVRHASSAMFGVDVPDDISEVLRDSPWRDSPG